MIATITKERQKVTDRDNLINELIQKVSEMDGNFEEFSKKFMDLRSNTGPVQCEKTTEKSVMNDKEVQSKVLEDITNIEV